MTPGQAKQVQTALSKFGDKTKATLEDKEQSIWKITLPFDGDEGKAFYMYAFQRAGLKKIYLSDGGVLLRTIKGCGQPQMHAMQDMLETYGLTLMEDFSVIDMTDRSLSIRVMSFLQAWCAVDGVLRIWKISQENVKNALRRTA